MGHSYGRITAPVSTDDVAAVLGKNSHDVATLCTQEDINPHSLIRPLYVGDNPDFTPDKFENMPAMGDIPQGGDAWAYEHMKWGYWVPYVTAPARIEEIEDVPWRRNYPAIGDDSFKILNHFDGYQNEAVPHLPVDADIEQGKNIVLRLYPGNAQANIISETPGNNGGVVAIPEVLGAVRIGCTVVEGYVNEYHYISPNPISISGKNDYVVIDTGRKAKGNVTYKVIPWATFGDITSNGTPTAGSHFYSLKFSDDFEGYIEVTTDNQTVGLRATVSKTSGGIVFETTVSNYLTTAQHVYNFRLDVTYKSNGVMKSRTVSLNGSERVDIAAKGSSSITLSTTDTDLYNNYDNITDMKVIATWPSSNGAKELQSNQLAGNGGPTIVIPPVYD